MRTALFALVLAASAFLAGAPAYAQRTITAEGAMVMRDYARCVANAAPRAAASLLGSDPSSAGYRNEIFRMTRRDGFCLRRGEFRFSEIFFAGGLAEALLGRARGGRPLAAMVAFQADRPPVRAADEIEAMAMCTVRAEPARVEALFASGPMGAREQGLLRELAPTVQSCLAAGQSLRLHRANLRAVLALAAYRLSAAAAPVS